VGNAMTTVDVTAHMHHVHESRTCQSCRENPDEHVLVLGWRPLNAAHLSRVCERLLGHGCLGLPVAALGWPPASAGLARQLCRAAGLAVPEDASFCFFFWHPGPRWDETEVTRGSRISVACGVWRGNALIEDVQAAVDLFRQRLPFYFRLVYMLSEPDTDAAARRQAAPTYGADPRFGALPSDLLRLVFLRVEARDIARGVGLVCRAWRRVRDDCLASADVLWEQPHRHWWYLPKLRPH